MSIRETLLLGAALSIFLPPVAQAADADVPADQSTSKPAVSAFNGKVDYLGGTLDARSAHLAEGSFALPLGHSFGFQADAVGGGARGGMVKGFGGHAFWRDPDIGLVGVTASRFGLDSVFGNRFGAEAEAYFGPVTVALNGGLQNGKLQHAGWGNADLRYYPVDDLMLTGGWGIYHTEHTGHFGVEWQPGVMDFVPGLALFGDAGVGGQHYGHVLGGLRIYFGGGDKSLKRRHREDDPESVLMNAVTQVLRPSRTKPSTPSTSSTPSTPPTYSNPVPTPSSSNPVPTPSTPAPPSK